MTLNLMTQHTLWRPETARDQLADDKASSFHHVEAAACIFCYEYAYEKGSKAKDYALLWDTHSQYGLFIEDPVGAKPRLTPIEYQAGNERRWVKREA